MDEKLMLGTPTRTRGSMLEWEHSKVRIFTPYVRCKNKQRHQVINTTKYGKYYKNVGEKKTSYTLHCTVPGTVKNPTVALLLAALETLKH